MPLTNYENYQIPENSNFVGYMKKKIENRKNFNWLKMLKY